MKNLKERLVKFLFIQGQSCMWKVSVQDRILGKNAPLPGEKQMSSRPGKAFNVFLPVCSRNVLAGYGNKAVNCLCLSSWSAQGGFQARKGWANIRQEGLRSSRCPGTSCFSCRNNSLAQSLCAFRLHLRKRVGGSSLHKIFWQRQPVPCWCAPQACTHFTEEVCHA